MNFYNYGETATKSVRIIFDELIPLSIAIFFNSTPSGFPTDHGNLPLVKIILSLLLDFTKRIPVSKRSIESPNS